MLFRAPRLQPRPAAHAPATRAPSRAATRRVACLGDPATPAHGSATRRAGEEPRQPPLARGGPLPCPCRDAQPRCARVRRAAQVRTRSSGRAPRTSGPGGAQAQASGLLSTCRPKFIFVTVLQKMKKYSEFLSLPLASRRVARSPQLPPWCVRMRQGGWFTSAAGRRPWPVAARCRRAAPANPSRPKAVLVAPVVRPHAAQRLERRRHLTWSYSEAEGGGIYAVTRDVLQKALFASP